MIEVSQSVKNLAGGSIRLFEAVQDTGAGEIAVDWRGNVARRTGRFQDSIGARDAVMMGDVRTILINAPAAEQYSGVYEFGWTNRARGQLSYPGRYAAKRAIETADHTIKELIDEAGKKIERGEV